MPLHARGYDDAVVNAEGPGPRAGTGVPVDALRDLWQEDLALEGAAVDPGAGSEAALAVAMRSATVALLELPLDRTWVWSDLHLSDPAVIPAFDRPFADVGEMNDYLLREWRRCVRPRDTLICLGDVAHADAWADRQLVRNLRACPGRRIVVLGNHDLPHREALADVGFEEQYLAALLDADPPLALVHMPLRRVPVTAVALHGHLNGASGLRSVRFLGAAAARPGGSS